MTRPTVLALIFVLVAPCFHSHLAAEEPPTFGDLASLEANVPLGPKQEDVIRKHMRHWVGQLKAAKKFDEVKQARDKLWMGSHAQATAYYQLTYAQIAAAEIPVLLSLGDRLKQIHAAMAMSRMPRYTIQPALEKMAASKNPAVRYWAVHGYRQVRKEMMLHRGRAKIMLATLRKLGMTEPASATVGAVFRALRPYGGIKPADLASRRTELSKIWLARCGEVSQANLGFIDAYREEIIALAPLDEKDDTKAVLQLLADVMEAGSMAFDAKATKSDAGVRASLEELLIDTEARLGKILDVAVRPVRDALRNKDAQPAARIADALDAIKYTWTTSLLMKWKVTPRRIPRPVANTTTKPTTAPSPEG